jgi:hypothetical protein
MPRLATSRKKASTQMFGANAHADVPIAYTTIVSISVRVRPMRSATMPNSTPPVAQPSSSTDVSAPVQNSVACFAAGLPISSPSSVGTQFGAT